MDFSLKHRLAVLLFLLLTACDEFVSQDHHGELISGRDNGTPPYARENLWRIKRPLPWNRKKEPSGSIQDSRIAVAEFQIGEGEQAISVFIHSFPSNSEEERIPPMAQVNRWKEQLDKSTPLEFHLSRQAFSGYAGLLLDARGKKNGKDVRMLAWALSLSPKNYYVLGGGERASDIIIKVLGDEESVDLHEEEIRSFARSFELIEAIP